MSHCSTCTCHDPGEAFALRPSTSSEWARKAAIEAAKAAVEASKDKRKGARSSD